jgi:hypothetical protein
VGWATIRTRFWSSVLPRQNAWSTSRCWPCSNGHQIAPDKWHKIGNLEATKRAAELLAKRGVIEIWPETNLYRLKPRGGKYE